MNSVNFSMAAVLENFSGMIKDYSENRVIKKN